MENSVESSPRSKLKSCWSCVSLPLLELLGKFVIELKMLHFSQRKSSLVRNLVSGQSLKAVVDMVDVADIKTPRAFIFVRRSPRGIVKP